MPFFVESVERTAKRDHFIGKQKALLCSFSTNHISLMSSKCTSRKLNMSDLDKILFSWPKPYITSKDLFGAVDSANKYSFDRMVKNALNEGKLLRMRRGLYLISSNLSKKIFDPFEMAQVIYNPSYISFESALSYHGWIPEAVYTTTSATLKKSITIETPKGYFSYALTPKQSFFLNVQSVNTNEGLFLIAEPWKALADYIYSSKKAWPSIRDLTLDLRIEPETLHEADFSSLERLTFGYSDFHTKKILERFLKELKT